MFSAGSDQRHIRRPVWFFHDDLTAADPGLKREHYNAAGETPLSYCSRTYCSHAFENWVLGIGSLSRSSEKLKQGTYHISSYIEERFETGFAARSKAIVLQSPC